jgi:hypothetical protein
MCIEEFFDHRAEHLSDFDDPCHQVLGVLAPGRFRPPLGYSEYSHRAASVRRWGTRSTSLSDFDDPCHQVGPRRSSLSHCHERLRLRLRLRGCAVRGALLLTSYLGGDAAPVRLLFCFCPV